MFDKDDANGFLHTCGLKSSTARNKTFFAPLGAGGDGDGGMGAGEGAAKDPLASDEPQSTSVPRVE